MAVRTPLYNNSGNIQEMSATQIQQIKDFCTLKYFTGNPVELQVDVGNGNIGSISDTRLQAGAVSTSASSFPSEATTAEPSVVTITRNNIKQVLATTPTLTNAPSVLFTMTATTLARRAPTLTRLNVHNLDHTRLWCRGAHIARASN